MPVKLDDADQNQANASPRNPQFQNQAKGVIEESKTHASQAGAKDKIHTLSLKQIQFANKEEKEEQKKIVTKYSPRGNKRVQKEPMEQPA